MIFLYNKDNSEVETLLTEINQQTDIQKANLKTLHECLKIINYTIQTTDEIDNVSQLNKILKDLKINLDNSRNNISNLNKLEKLLLKTSEQLNTENPKLSNNIDEFNNLATKCQKEIYVSLVNIQDFTLQYIKKLTFMVSTPISESSIPTHSSKAPNETKNENLVDNTTLLISEIQNKVFLPYTISDLEKKLKNSSSYNNIEEIINEEYIIPLDKYKNASISRFREAYNLMRKKENASIADSLDLALELYFNNLLNPAIITACKNLDELDVYIDCLSSNELDKFHFFEIKYEILPK